MYFSPPLSGIVVFPEGARLREFCLALTSKDFRAQDEWNQEPEPKAPLAFSDLRRFLHATPYLRKFIIIFGNDSGFRHLDNDEDHSDSLPPSFSLEYFEVRRQEYPLSRSQYDWILASSRDSLQTAIVDIEAVEALQRCTNSLHKLSIPCRLSFNRQLIHSSDLESLSQLIKESRHLRSLALHAFFLEEVLQRGNLPPSLQHLIIGASTHEFTLTVWKRDYRAVSFKIHASGPSSIRAGLSNLQSIKFDLFNGGDLQVANGKQALAAAFQRTVEQQGIQFLVDVYTEDEGGSFLISPVYGCTGTACK